jgi:peroxiredoxin
MADTYARQGLTVVAVNLDHDHHDAERFLRKFNPTFEVRFDPHGQMAEHFKVKGMPTSVVIDRQGALRFTHMGYQILDQATYEAQIRELLAEQ